jgi:hypothetical protein
MKRLNVRLIKWFSNRLGFKIVMIRMGNRNVETYFYDKKIKSKMIYHLKKEGFRFSSYTGQCGYYIKEL